MSALRFSVVLSTERDGPAPRQAVADVLAQDETSWELLVADGPDAVAVAPSDPRVRVLPGGARAGELRNEALRAARGEHVAYLDAGDGWRADHLTTLGRLLDAGADVAFGGCRRRACDGTVRTSTLLDVIWSPELQLAGPMVEPSRLAHRAGVAEAAGGWHPDQPPNGWDLWVRLRDRRWATTAAATATVRRAPGPRSDEQTVGTWVPVAPVPDEPTARAAMAAVRRPPERRRLQALHAEAARAWYEDELRAGRLVLPEGTDRVALEAALAVPAADPTALLTARIEPDGRWTLGRALETTDTAHGDRAAALLYRRLASKYAYLRRVVAAVAAARATGVAA